MQGSAIQWCDDTVNPTMGCDGCELWSTKGENEVRRCYAGQLHVRHGGRNSGYAPRFEQLTLFPGRMQQATKLSDLGGRRRTKKPWLNGHPRLIFVSDMSDALSNDVSFEFLQFEVIRQVASPHGQRHRWLWLTKRPERMAEFYVWLKTRGQDWPSNLWPGTSLTTKNSRSRVQALLKVGRTQTTTRFLSVEPQWEDIPLAKEVGRVDWVIQGGESGHEAKDFDIQWARELRDVCQRKNTPYFLKQFGERPYDGDTALDLQDRHGGEWGEWPADLRVREIPEDK